MTTKVKTHKRKGKNKVSVVKEHTRKGGCSKKKGSCSGCEYEKKFSKSRIKKVSDAYENEGIAPPEGKGIHKVAFHERAAKIMGSMKKSGKKVNRNMAYAIAMKQLGRKKSVLKEHQR